MEHTDTNARFRLIIAAAGLTVLGLATPAGGDKMPTDPVGGKPPAGAKGKTYSLTVPKDVPINKFRSLTVYDMETWPSSTLRRTTRTVLA